MFTSRPARPRVTRPAGSRSRPMGTWPSLRKTGGVGTSTRVLGWSRGRNTGPSEGWASLAGFSGVSPSDRPPHLNPLLVYPGPHARRPGADLFDGLGLV